MSYTVLMMRFEEDGSVSTYPLEPFFPTPELAFVAGKDEIATQRSDPAQIVFQSRDLLPTQGDEGVGRREPVSGETRRSSGAVNR